MVVCDPGTSLQDLRQLVKQDTGISVSSLTKQDICDAYASMGSGIVLPPMRMSRDGSYLIDVASPLEVKDYKVLFKSSSTIGELKSVARKVKAVVVDGAKKTDVVRAIRDRLNRLNVAEPVQLRSTKRTKVSKKTTAAAVPVTSNNVVNTKEMVANAGNNANAAVANAVAKEENRRTNANVKIANLQNKLNTTQDPTEKNAIRRNLNAMRAENAEARKAANNRIAALRSNVSAMNQKASNRNTALRSNVSAALSTANQKASNRNTALRSNVSTALRNQNQKASNRNAALRSNMNQKALSAIATAKANVTQQIASIEQNRQVQVQNSRARQNALAEEQKILKEQLKSANTEIAQQKAQQALSLVEFKKELESNFEKKQKNALATIQMQKNVAAKKVANANTDLEKMKAKQELEFQERLLKMKLQEKAFLEQRLNGMLNLTEKERGDFKKMYETSSLDEVIQKASELNEQKGLNKKVTEAAVVNAKQEAANAKAKENAAIKEAQNAKNAQRKAEQNLKNAQTAAQVKAAQNAANDARKRAENAERKVNAAQKEKVMNSSALVAQLTALIQEQKKVPVSTNNAQAQRIKNDQIARLEAELNAAKRNVAAQVNAAKRNANAAARNAAAQVNAAKKEAAAQINVAKRNANAARNQAVAAANAKAKAEQALKNAASNANRKKLQNALNAAKRESNNAKRQLQEELQNTRKLIVQLQSKPQVAAANTSGIAQLQTQIVALQEQIGKQNRIPGVQPPVNAPNAPKPPNTPKPNANNNIGKQLNKSQTIKNARLQVAKKEELARLEEREREVERAQEEARKKDEEGRRLAMEREEANKRMREAKTEAERQAAEKARQLANEEIARAAKEKAALNKKANLFSVGGNDTYLKQYLTKTGQELGSMNVAGYKAKVLKDMKLAQLEANTKPQKTGSFYGLFGSKAKPKLEYVNEGQYNQRLRIAQTKVNVKAQAEVDKANAERLLGMGGDRAYLNAYRKSMNNVPYSNINANAYKKKFQKDLELAKKVQEINGTSVPKVVFVSNANYNARLQNLNAKLENKRERNRVAAEDKAKVNSLMKVAPGVTVDYLQAFAKSRNLELKNINKQELTNKVKQDEEIRGMVEQLQGKGMFKTKPKLVFVNNVNTRRAELQKQLNNKQKAENDKAESIRLTKEEAQLIKNLSKNFGVDAGYLKAFANGKPMRDLNKNALKAKLNKDMEVAKIKATAVKSSFTGKYANAKPVIKFIKNANYNKTLANAKRNMNARIANRDEKNTKVKTKQAMKNTKALIAKLATSGPIKVDAAYVEAFLADNAHKLFDAQKLNANRSKLNARIKLDDELAKIRDKKRIEYTKVSEYVNARKKAANDRMTRSLIPNKAKTKELMSSILQKLTKAGTPADKSYVEKFLKDNEKQTVLTLEANVQPLITKIQKDQKIANLNATDVKGTFGGWKTSKGTLKYVTGPANDAIKAAENRLKVRQEKKKAEENKAGRKSNAKTINITARGEAISQKIRNTPGITMEAKNALANEIRKDLTSTFTSRRTKWVNNVELNKRLKKLQSDPKTRARTGAQKTFKANRREENVNINAFKKTAGFNNDNAKKPKPKLTLNAAKNEIKKLVAKGKSLNSARRLLSPKYHPNRGGTKENFQTLENAYEALKKNEVVNAKKTNNAKKPNVNMRTQLKLEAAKRRENKNEFQNASNKTFNERNAELGREKTRLVQRVNKNIPGVFGSYRRTWQSNIRQATNKNALTAIEKLLDEKVKLRSEIQSAKISNKDRSGHLRWVMQKKNDVQKRREELARHVSAEAKKANENAAAKKKAEANAAAKKAEANAAAKKKANENAAAKKKANAERNALKKEIDGSNIGVKNRQRFIRDLNAGKKVANVRKQFNAKKKAPKSKTVMQLAAPAPNKKPVSKAGTKALANAAKKKELAGKLRLAAKKSVAQNIKKSSLGNKSKQQLLTQLKKKKTGPKSVQNNLKKKTSSGGARTKSKTRKQLNQKFTFATAKNTKPTRGESWRFQ